MKSTATVSLQEIRQRAEELLRAGESLIREPTSPEETQQLIHELRVHQIQLEMQNDELRRVHAALDASQARYFELYDLAPVGYLTLNESGLILEANLAAANLLGVARGALIKQPLSRFFSKEHQDSFYLYRQKILTSGTSHESEMCFRRPDGSSFWVLMRFAPVVDSECRVIFRPLPPNMWVN